jgi:hypothetical protein
MLGKKAENIFVLMPNILLLVGLYVICWLREDGFIWIYWAVLLWAFAAMGHPSPLNDEVELDRKRIPHWNCYVYPWASMLYSDSF